MNQFCPLPERIPTPSPEQLIALEKMNITIDSDAEKDNAYAKYTLPLNWKMISESKRSDLPRFYIVDTENYKRVLVNGVWKGSYDNELDLIILDGTEMYKEPIHDLLEEKFQFLLQSCYNTIHMTIGTENRGQFYVDKAYQNLMAFVDQNPTFKNKIPKRL